MPNKLTDKEIVKALEWCKSKCGCGNCFLKKEEYCVNVLKNLTLDLINRLQEKVKFAENINHLQMEELQSQKAENERLKNENTLLSQNSLANKYPLCVWIGDNLILSKSEQDYDKLIANIKTEAYKECIEKVKEHSNKTELVCSGALVRTDYTITEEKLDNLSKELVGEDK